MVHIRSFQGYVVQPELAIKLIAPPYDVLDTQEAKIMADGNEFSFLHVNKPEIDLDEKMDPYDDKVYLKGKENLDSFISKGWVQYEKEPILYIYAQKMGNILQFGIMLEASVDEYEKNIIKKHELTRKKKEDDRTKLTNTQSANVGPVFLTYSDCDDINRKVGEIVKDIPYFHVTTKDDVQHTLWKCNKEDSSFLVKAFEKVNCLYIADGHHRAASAYNVGKMRKEKAIEAGIKITGDEDFNYFLAIVYPASQLHIFDYNRVLKDLNSKTPKEIFNELEQIFSIRKFDKGENPKPQRKNQFSFFIEKQWFELTLRKEFSSNDPIKGLDVEILTQFVIGPIFGIKDIRNDERIDFVGGIRGLKELERRCEVDCVCGFAVFEVQIEEVMKVADYSLIMPPKSTWFEPKPRSGAVIRVFKI